MPQPELLSDLRTIVGERGLVTGDAVRARASSSWLGAVEAQVLVRPSTTAEVSQVLALCNARSQAVVPHGGLTGLVHGATAGPDEIILSLEWLNSIERVDVAGRTINAGGTRVVRYGMARGLVLGLEVVLADGTVLTSLNRMLKNNAGYDLKQLFIGSEGTLGVVTRAELRLVAKPRSHDTALVAAPDFAALVRVLHHLDAGLAGQLSAFEAMWGNFYDINTAPPTQHSAPLARGAAMYALIESLGAEPVADQARLEGLLGELLEAGVITDAALAKSDQERRAMWAIREDVFAVSRIARAQAFDVSLPIDAMLDYTRQVATDLRSIVGPERTFIFGHLADGNLHLVVASGEDVAVRRRVEEVIYRPLADIGGSVSAEHGIGTERIDYLSWSRTPAEIELMRTLKRALDPRGILNPGKVILTKG
ncbi:MAG: FAD-binding oxidoreductase [Proteobacteria bacterium]|nr:FAD-binding oxidoreductase [Pseudomonadota bacterium]